MFAVSSQSLLLNCHHREGWELTDTCTGEVMFASPHSHFGRIIFVINQHVRQSIYILKKYYFLIFHMHI